MRWIEIDWVGLDWIGAGTDKGWEGRNEGRKEMMMGEKGQGEKGQRAGCWPMGMNGEGILGFGALFGLAGKRRGL